MGLLYYDQGIKKRGKSLTLGCMGVSYLKDEQSLPLISIITVCKDAEMYIEDTIVSVLSQNYPNIEYIIIDGKSSDKTIEIIEKYIDHIDYFISEPDEGISDAFNKGIAKANGAFIGIMNAGDYFYNNNSLMSMFNDEALEGDVLQGMQIMKNYETGYEYVLRPSDKYGHIYSLLRFYPNHMATFISKDIYTMHGGYRTDYKVCMDIELLYRYHREKVKITYLDQTIGIYRHGGFSDKNDWLGTFEKMRILKEDGGNFFEYGACSVLLITKNLIKWLAQMTIGMDVIRSVWYKKDKKE